MKKLIALLLCAFAVTTAFAQTPKKVLVTYFSATGTTKGAAEMIAKEIGSNATLYEIVPEQIYTDKDLDWHDKKSRTTVEQRNDKSIRPKIASKKFNVADYDVIFIGFPIWWYEEPRIINTFLDSYDFSGKTLVAFSTSGGSGIGQAEKNMKKAEPKAKFLKGKNFYGSADASEVKSWIKDLKF